MSSTRSTSGAPASGTPTGRRPAFASPWTGAHRGAEQQLGPPVTAKTWTSASNQTSSAQQLQQMNIAACMHCFLSEAQVAHAVCSPCTRVLAGVFEHLEHGAREADRLTGVMDQDDNLGVQQLLGHKQAADDVVCNTASCIPNVPVHRYLLTKSWDTSGVFDKSERSENTRTLPRRA